MAAAFSRGTEARQRTGNSLKRPVRVTLAEAGRALLRGKEGWIGTVLVVMMLLTAVLGPFVFPIDPYALDITHRFAGPSASHLLGTDYLGRD
ncbi:MAG: ABC transporter permease, partial [Deltaproteobacteria bacterium]